MVDWVDEITGIQNCICLSHSDLIVNVVQFLLQGFFLIYLIRLIIASV